MTDVTLMSKLMPGTIEILTELIKIMTGNTEMTEIMTRMVEMTNEIEITKIMSRITDKCIKMLINWNNEWFI